MLGGDVRHTERNTHGETDGHAGMVGAFHRLEFKSLVSTSGGESKPKVLSTAAQNSLIRRHFFLFNGFLCPAMLSLSRGESMSVREKGAVAVRIRKLAQEHHVTYVHTSRDVLAHHITRLAGDDVQLDEVEQLLIALQRSGHLSRSEMVKLQAAYLREARQ